MIYSAFLEWSPERLLNPVVIVSLIFLVAGFLVTVLSSKIAAPIANKTFKEEEGQDENAFENHLNKISVIIKFIGLAVVIAFAVTVVVVL